MKSNPVVLTFTAGVDTRSQQLIARAFEAAGIIHVESSFVHPVTAGSALPLAPGSVEVRVSSTGLEQMLAALGDALARVRTRIPEVGLLLVVERDGVRNWFAWRRDASAESVKGSVLALPEATISDRSFGWDAARHEWMRT